MSAPSDGADATIVYGVNHDVLQAGDGEMKKILTFIEEPLVLVDYNHSSASSNFDATQVKVQGRWVKIMSRYDNE